MNDIALIKTCALNAIGVLNGSDESNEFHNKDFVLKLVSSISDFYLEGNFRHFSWKTHETWEIMVSILYIASVSSVDNLCR